MVKFRILKFFFQILRISSKFWGYVAKFCGYVALSQASSSPTIIISIIEQKTLTNTVKSTIKVISLSLESKSSHEYLFPLPLIQNKLSPPNKSSTQTTLNSQSQQRRHKRKKSKDLQKKNFLTFFFCLFISFLVESLILDILKINIERFILFIYFLFVIQLIFIFPLPPLSLPVLFNLLTREKHPSRFSSHPYKSIQIIFH